MAKKKPKILRDGLHGTAWVRAWKENRQEFAVQVWLSGQAVGEPDDDWAMPAVIGLEGSIAQAVLQTKPKES